MQKIRLSDVLPHGEHAEGGASSVRYVICNVLPAMRKDRIYAVRTCSTVPGDADTSTNIRAAYCVCPAGLAGSCNHVAALMYALEDFVRQGLREEAAKTCTEKLKAWNPPRARKVKPLKVSEVFLVKEEFTK